MFQAFFMPGPIELLIIAVIVLGPLVAVAVVLLVVLRRGNAGASAPPCPKCGGWTVIGSRFCHHCGGPLGGPPSK